MRKKVIVFGIGFLAFIFLLVLFVFMGKKNQNSQTTNTKTLNSQKNQPENLPQDSVSPEINLSMYTSSYFSFSYFPTLNIIEGIADAEGYTVIVKSQESFTPELQIVVQANPSGKVSVPRIEAVLTAFQLKPSNTIVGGNNIPAIVYTDVSGKRQQTVTIIEYNGYVYRIDMSYESEQASAEADTYYRQILSTFQPR